MPPFVLWVAVAIGGNVLYHVSQKSIPFDGASAPIAGLVLISKR